MTDFAVHFAKEFACGRTVFGNECDQSWWDNRRYFAIHFVGAIAFFPALIGFVRFHRLKRVVFIVVTACMWLVPIAFLYMTIDHNPMEEFCQYLDKESKSGSWLHALMYGGRPCQIVWHHWLIYASMPLAMVSPIVYGAMFWLSRQKRPDLA